MICSPWVVVLRKYDYVENTMSVVFQPAMCPASVHQLQTSLWWQWVKLTENSKISS